MDFVPNEIFFHIHSFLPLVDSIKSSRVSHGWNACIKSYLTMRDIKPNKIILLQDLIDHHYQPIIINTHHARNIFYHILCTRNFDAFSHYSNQKIFQSFKQNQISLVLLKDPDHPVKQWVKHEYILSYTTLLEAIYCGEEEIAKNLTNYLDIYSSFSEVIENASDDFIIWFSKIHHNTDSIIKSLLEMEKCHLIEKIIDDGTITLNNRDLSLLIEYGKVNLVKPFVEQKVTATGMDVFFTVPNYIPSIITNIFKHNKMWMIDELEISHEQIQNVISSPYFDFNDHEESMMWLIKKSLIPENKISFALLKSIDNEWFECVQILMSMTTTLAWNYFFRIKSVLMLELLIPHFGIESSYALDEALSRNRLDLAKRYYQFEQKPEDLLKIKIAEEKPYLTTALFDFWNPPYLIQIPLRNQINKITQDDIKWLLNNGYPYSHIYLRKYYQNDSTMIEWLEVNGYLYFFDKKN